MVTLARKLMDAPASGSGCNLTIGSGSGYYGYETGVIAGPFGSISVEPIPGETLAFALWQSGGGLLSVAFVGDLETELDGLEIYLDSVNYEGGDKWTFDGTYTVSTQFSGPTLTSGTYLFEVK